MPAVKNVGEPCAREPHARFEAAAGGNQAPVDSGRAEPGASRRPYKNRVFVRGGRRWRRGRGFECRGKCVGVVFFAV
jgi:hypothetical protein